MERLCPVHRCLLTYSLHLNRKLDDVYFFNMPHVVCCCENMDEFVALHNVQLLSSGIPEHLWESLYLKLKFEVLSLSPWQLS